MIYRMFTSMVIWVTASLMVMIGKLRERELGYVLAAATLSTIAVWALQPATSSSGKTSE
jgi:hypothetical protein